jgi:hypothetical protein
VRRRRPPPPGPTGEFAARARREQASNRNVAWSSRSFVRPRAVVDPRRSRGCSAGQKLVGRLLNRSQRGELHHCSEAA